MKYFFDRVFTWIETVGAGVWLGALIGFGYAVAGSVFRELPTVNLAGHVNAAIIAKLNRLEFAAAACLAVPAIYFLLRAEWWTALRLVKTVLVVAMVVTLLYYALFVGDRLEELRALLNFDAPGSSPAGRNARALLEEFTRLHERYTALVKANLAMGATFLLLSAFERR